VRNKCAFSEENAKQYAFGLMFSTKYVFQNAKKSRLKSFLQLAFYENTSFKTNFLGVSIDRPKMN